MAIWNEKFYKGTDVYSDGSIEDEILEIVCRDDYNAQKDNLIGNNYTIAYHLSPIRENILNWYPFTKEEKAIEIGAGCGAITGMLCQKLGKVVSVDLSKRRSRINYERHKEYDNLEIIIGNFNDVELSEKYDYVVLNGVFEYAISFTDAEKPYHEFLRHISRFLKPNGKFLISIENKLGLKYFNGAKEDHTGNYFLGLNDYADNKTVRTFSKTELEQILADEGFSYTKFYYPYPDYKFPNEIFTEESIESNQYGRPFINIENDRYWLFDENAVGKTLIKENVRNVFANSFLVEACKEEFESEVLYAKLNVERKPEFQIGTSIVERDNEKKVIKYAINPLAENHIDNICYTTEFDGEKVKYLQASKNIDGIYFEFLYEKNLDAHILELIQKKDCIGITDAMNLFFEAYLSEFSEVKESDNFYSETFNRYFGNAKIEKSYLCIKQANIDVIMDNVYKLNDKYVLIDGEWIYPEWIPYVFIKWRAINELYSKHNDLYSLIPRNKMLENNGITPDDEKIFLDWATYFANSYVGGAQRGRWAKKIQEISFDQIHQEMRAKKIANMSLYLDFGEGFSEESKLYQDVNIEKGEFEVTFCSEELRRAKKLRFDPIEGFVCVVKITNMSDGVALIGENSAEELESGKLFINLDPQFYIDVNKEISSVSIKANLKIYHKDELTKCLQEINDKRLMLNAHLSNVENRVRELFEELGETSNQLGETRNYLEICKNTIVTQHNQKEVLSIKIDEKEELIKALMLEKNYWQSENEKHEYLANSTKAFLKRKIKLKLKSLLKCD